MTMLVLYCDASTFTVYILKSGEFYVSNCDIANVKVISLVILCMFLVQYSL